LQAITRKRRAIIGQNPESGSGYFIIGWLAGAASPQERQNNQKPQFIHTVTYPDVSLIAAQSKACHFSIATRKINRYFP
jgi:hypothetical protein